MSKTEEFETYWLIGDQRFDNFAKVERLVDSGKVAAEFSAASQAEAHEHQVRLQIRLTQAHERAAKLIAEQQHARAPAGQREQALRTATENPGGLVSSRNVAFDELDQYAPDATNLLK